MRGYAIFQNNSKNKLIFIINIFNILLITASHHFFRHNFAYLGGKFALGIILKTAASPQAIAAFETERNLAPRASG